MISGVVMQTRVASDDEILNFTASLYAEFSAPHGIIYMRQRTDPEHSELDDRRVDVMARLNRPDYDIVTYPNVNPPENTTSLKTVYLLDNVVLRVPVRELARQFSSVFATSETMNAPGIATFSRFYESQVAPINTTFIALPDYTHAFLGAPSAGQMGTLLAALPPPLVDPMLYQAPIQMNEKSWTVVGTLWAVVAVAFAISIGVTYGWYIRQYL